jgi:hypothetical protein
MWIHRARQMLPLVAAVACVLDLGVAGAATRLRSVADTFVTPDGPELDHGGARQIKVQATPKVAYLKFDLGAARVRRATLVLAVTNSSPVGGTVYGIDAPDWIEGTGDETIDDTSGLRFLDVDRTGDGVLDAADGSPFVPAAERAVAIIGPVVREEVVAIDVTAAVAGRIGLATLAIASASRDMATYASREHPDTDRHPMLEIEVDDDPPPTSTTTATTSTSTTTTATTSTTTSTAATATTLRPTTTTATTATTSTAPSTTVTSTTRTTTTSTSVTTTTATSTTSTSRTTTTRTSSTTTTTRPPPVGGAPGHPAVVPVADSDFDAFTRQPTLAAQAWMRDRYHRMLTYTPYFDSRLAWFPDAWAYKDLYAIYRSSTEATAHADWILRDAIANLLYIPYGCGGGTCPQYAADPGNPEFRTAWIATARTVLNRGYRGLYIDDVNLFMSRVGNGQGQAVVPIDPRTGVPMTEADWRRYVAEFVEEIRAAFPDHEIVHNAIWYVGDDDPYVRRQIAAADVQWLERGANDGGLVGGSGRFAYDTFLGHLDRIHALGGSFVLAGQGANDAAREYGLASYLLAADDRDALCHSDGVSPADWWTAGWDIDLGVPLGVRYRTDGLWRRDYTRGVVLLNPPGAPTRTVALDPPVVDLSGERLDALVLDAKEGAVLRLP